MRLALLLFFICLAIALTAQPFISEFHYDNAGGDVGEFVEITGAAGTDVGDYTIVHYNGNGTVIKTLTFPSPTIISNQDGGFGAVFINTTGLQNDTEGFALVDDNGNVLEFISYEGTVTATAGPANGMTSSDIGVAEDGTTPIGNSLSYNGTWSSGAETPGMVNPGLAAFLNSALPVTLSGLAADRHGKTAIVKWSTATESGNSHFVVERSQDGLAFNEVGRISGAGDSQTAINYNFSDQAPATGENYYRLRQVDLTGASTLFGPVLVSFASEGLTAFPNPVGDRLFVSGASENSRTTILDLNGRVLSSKLVSGDGIATEGLAPGTYLLRVENAAGIETLRFVKQ